MRESRAPLMQDDVEGFLGREILADVGLHLLAEIVIVEDRDLYVEDRRFLGAGVTGRSIAHLCETFLRALDGVAKALELCGRGVVGDDARGGGGHLPPQEVHWPNNDAR